MLVFNIDFRHDNNKIGKTETLEFQQSENQKSEPNLTSIHISDVNVSEKVNSTDILQSQLFSSIDVQDIDRGSIERKYICPYSEEELEMARWIVQQEVMDGSIKHKIIIAQVLVNRLNNGYWGGTLKEVMLADYQFPSKVNWFEKINPPDEDTNKAIQEVLIDNSREDLSHGALYFYAPDLVDNQDTINWFESLEFLFEFEGHRFYK
jgi:spore germination cell wall hydrolase CwlJ-like protein